MRFGHSVRSAADLAATARRLEGDGYDVLLLADHFGMASPFSPLAAAAQVTERLRVGTFVVNQDLWPLATLVREAATVDLLSAGRFELGIGAGHMASEYESAGLPFDPAGVRVDRLEEVVPLLRRLLDGEEVTYAGRHVHLAGHRQTPPAPQGAALPLLVGGNGSRVLGLAAREADTVGFVGFHPADGGRRPAASHFTWAGLADRVAVVEAAAPHRRPERNVLLQHVEVTDDAAAAWTRFLDGRPDDGPWRDSPFVAIGSVASIIEHLDRLREEAGIGYVTVFEGRSQGFERVITASGSQ